MWNLGYVSNVSQSTPLTRKYTTDKSSHHQTGETKSLHTPLYPAGIPKLEDANDAGTRHSQDCTLILTEGDSAKTLAVSGLGVVGRDRYGVFPLKGKLLNVREASHKQVTREGGEGGSDSDIIS